MYLTRFSDIGLRVLMYLTHAGDRAVPVTIAEIAAQFDLPTNHLVKVVGELNRHGWIRTTRGRHGRVCLNIIPDSLKIGVVLRKLEGEGELVDCQGQSCRLSPDCILRGALAEGLRAFYEAMDRYTLADVTRRSTGQKVVRMHREFMQRLSMSQA